jgi:hypothetical protein
MTAIPEFSAFHRASHTGSGVSEAKGKTAIKGWEFDGGKHPAFDAASGVYTIQRDGLYAVYVQVLPSDGRAHVAREVLSVPRTSVQYVLRVSERRKNSTGGHVDDEDAVEDEYLDVGERSFGEVLHLRAGSELSLWAMPSARRDSLRLKVDILMRKRKRSPEPELSARELKKLERKRKRASGVSAVNGNDPNKGHQRAATESKADDTSDSGSDVAAHGWGFDPVTSAASDQESGAIVTGSRENDEIKTEGNEDDNEDDNDDEWSAEFSSDDSALEGDDDKGGVGRIAKKLRSSGTGGD